MNVLFHQILSGLATGGIYASVAPAYTIKPFPSPFPARPLFRNSYDAPHELGSIADGVHLALATFALGVALPQILKYRHVETWTGGV